MSKPDEDGTSAAVSALNRIAKMLRMFCPSDKQVDDIKSGGHSGNQVVDDLMKYCRVLVNLIVNEIVRGKEYEQTQSIALQAVVEIVACMKVLAYGIDIREYHLRSATEERRFKAKGSVLLGIMDRREAVRAAMNSTEREPTRGDKFATIIRPAVLERLGLPRDSESPSVWTIRRDVLAILNGWPELPARRENPGKA